MNDRTRARGTDHPRRGDTLKVVLIVVAVFIGVAVLSCAGIGLLGYFWVQKAIQQVAITSPQEIRRLTADMTDLSLPADFQPLHASNFLGIKVVSYRWCPDGRCPPGQIDVGDDGVLSLTTFNVGDDPSDPDAEGYSGMSDEELNEIYQDVTHEKREYTIRGQKCEFIIARGRERSTDEDSMDDDPANPPEEQPAEPVSPPPASGKRMVLVQGNFPGKKLPVLLSFRIPEDQYDEAKVLSLLESIR